MGLSTTLQQDTYAAWIRAYVLSEGGFLRGKCGFAARRMVKCFPELRVAAGFVTWAIPSRPIRDQHWWCVTKDGTIVDPTAQQFEGSIVPLVYEELDLNDPATRERVPTGRCMNCARDCYNDKKFCSDQCLEETTSHLNRVLPSTYPVPQPSSEGDAEKAKK